MSFLDSESMAQGAAGSSVKPMNNLASIIDISAAEGYLDGQGAASSGGPPNILSELDALDDDMMSKMKKRKSHHYGATASLGPGHLNN